MKKYISYFSLVVAAVVLLGLVTGCTKKIADDNNNNVVNTFGDQAVINSDNNQPAAVTNTEPASVTSTDNFSVSDIDKGY